MGLFGKKKEAESLLTAKKNWYSDRYQSAAAQRNFLALISITALVGIIFSVLTVLQISTSKKIEPFVIEIEEKTGITNVIRPLIKQQFTFNETLNRYFLTMYITSRESYDFYSYNHNYFTTVRLLSDSSVYGPFKRLVYAENPDSPLRFGMKLVRSVKIKSITFLKTAPGVKGLTAQVRFARYDSEKLKDHKVATIVFDYEDLKLTEEERATNPLGFQVFQYRLDDEVI